MIDEDAPWRPSRGLSLAPAALCALEDALPLELTERAGGGTTMTVRSAMSQIPIPAEAG